MSATSAGVVSSADSTINRRPGDSDRRIAAGFRPTTVITSNDSAAHPIRALASATEDTAGSTRTWLAPSRLTSVLPIPERNGSPEASTVTDRPPSSFITPGNALSSGDGHCRRS